MKKKIFNFFYWIFKVKMAVDSKTKNSNIKKKHVLLATPIITGLGLFYFFFDPNHYVFFIQCPFHKITGLYCPGCGSQRAIHELTHLNFYGFIDHNALLFFGFVIGIILWVFGKKELPDQINQPKFMQIILGITLLFGVLRNLDLFDFLAP